MAIQSTATSEQVWMNEACSGLEQQAHHLCQAANRYLMDYTLALEYALQSHDERPTLLAQVNGFNFNCLPLLQQCSHVLSRCNSHISDAP